MPDKVESIWDIERQLKDGQQLLALLAEVKAQILAKQNTLNSYKATQKEDLALLKSRVITEAEYRQRVVENTLKIEQYKVKVEDLNKEIKSSIGTKSQLIAREEEEAKIAAELSSDYKQLSLAYEAAAKRAKDYSASLGIAHPISVQAQKMRMRTRLST
jgi:rRNA maturation endonuclease Nob1